MARLLILDDGRLPSFLKILVGMLMLQPLSYVPLSFRLILLIISLLIILNGVRYLAFRDVRAALGAKVEGNSLRFKRPVKLTPGRLSSEDQLGHLTFRLEGDVKEVEELTPTGEGGFSSVFPSGWMDLPAYKAWLGFKEDVIIAIIPEFHHSISLERDFLSVSEGLDMGYCKLEVRDGTIFRDYELQEK